MGRKESNQTNKQTVWHSDVIPERILKKKIFFKNQQMTKKNEKQTACKELNTLTNCQVNLG